MQRETSEEIEAAAARWAARIDRAPLSADEERQLEQWQAGDSRRLGAFMRLRAVAHFSERARALGPGFDPDSFTERDDMASRPTSRRRMLWLGGSAIAACAVGALGLNIALGGSTYSTRLGEVRVVTLDDGSVVTLNTNSRIDVDFGADRRFVTLQEGEALFDVAKDPTRPFIVQAGATAVRAVGTSFTVKHLAASPVEVLVREGIVEVTRPSAARPVRMAANMRIVASEAGMGDQPVHMASEDITRDLAWKSGRIAFEGETLEQAAAAFERYSDIRILIDDPSVGREEITGLFAANDPVSFGRAVAASLDLKATIGPGEVRLSR